MLWNATKVKWIVDGWPTLDLQRIAVTAPGSILFSLMQRSPVYVPARNHDLGVPILHFVRNPKVCRHLLQEGENSDFLLEFVLPLCLKAATIWRSDLERSRGLLLRLMQNGQEVNQSRQEQQEKLTSKNRWRSCSRAVASRRFASHHFGCSRDQSENLVCSGRVSSKVCWRVLEAIAFLEQNFSSFCATLQRCVLVGERCEEARRNL